MGLGDASTRVRSLYRGPRGVEMCPLDHAHWWDVTVHVSERGFDFRAQKSKPPDDLVLTEHAQ